MVEVKQRTNKGYEIVCYYPKEHGRYTEKTGNTRIIWQTDDVAEVAAWFSRKAWGHAMVIATMLILPFIITGRDGLKNSREVEDDGNEYLDQI